MGWAQAIVAGLVICWGGICSAAAVLAQGTPPVSACRLESAGAGQVAAVTDGRSFVLDDGRAIRLAAIEVPPLPAGQETGAKAAAGLAARATLESMLLGREVQLRRHGPATTDRYGRLLADAYLTRAGAEGSVAHDLLERGLARVGTEPGDRACAAERLARERSARQAKLGLWGEPYYGIVGAESAAALLAERGQFTVVEGKVLSVRESGGTIYMNFGRRWSEGLTVTILKRHERTFTAVGMAPKQLENRLVRVRGWVEERNGPRIEALRPEQIEIAERN
jgi:endonuclease YncB( thermonuclease family)